MKEKEKRCGATATHGAQCGRHAKNPMPFASNHSDSIVRIQKWWRRKAPWIGLKCQGPAFHNRSLATNDQELFSLESLDTIPRVYFMSLADPNQSIWAFDIRSLTPLLVCEEAPKNPYTREIFLPRQMERLRSRIAWLTSRQIPLHYPQEEGLTEEQIWNQKVMDVFRTMEEHGYLVSVDWFHNLGTWHQMKFYRELQDIWFWRAGLSMADRSRVVSNQSSYENPLFRWQPRDPSLGGRSLSWWKKQNLERIRRLVSSSEEKDQRALGVTFVLMALVQVSEGAAEAFPWIQESVQ